MIYESVIITAQNLSVCQYGKMTAKDKAKTRGGTQQYNRGCRAVDGFQYNDIGLAMHIGIRLPQNSEFINGGGGAEVKE